MDFLEGIDRSLMLFFNGLHSPLFDFIFYYLSKTWIGFPLYIYVLFLFYKKNPSKQAIIFTVTIFVTVGLSDLISVHAFKNVFERYRPSHNLEIQDLLHYIHGYHGGTYGFVSSHAANMFAFATFSSLVIKSKPISIIVFVWAGIVSYSRIYLGVHYPADIICGALLGCLIAYITYALNKRYFSVSSFRTS